MNKENCIFCKIIAGDIPNDTVYEDDYTLAFLDIAPRAKGHTVVIPKTHALYITDMVDADISALFLSVKQVTSRLQEVLHPDGFSIGVNHGEAGGQAVPHVHVHIMPRWNGDGGGNMHSIVDAARDISVGEISQLFL
ncbi:HIT family protein [Patescibacteria group bacterium]|nr:HIT family protein [Patescibacteria group bacterium]MBU1721724.1 HIT family protein [Patescibacteria group bacterium]MBU1901436.1 HIT family protein [Patescibacteria group bacterium]